MHASVYLLEFLQPASVFTNFFLHIMSCIILFWSSPSSSYLPLWRNLSFCILAPHQLFSPAKQQTHLVGEIKNWTPMYPYRETKHGWLTSCSYGIQRQSVLSSPQAKACQLDQCCYSQRLWIAGIGRESGDILVRWAIAYPGTWHSRAFSFHLISVLHLHVLLPSVPELGDSFQG